MFLSVINSVEISVKNKSRREKQREAEGDFTWRGFEGGDYIYTQRRSECGMSVWVGTTVDVASSKSIDVAQ